MSGHNTIYSDDRSTSNTNEVRQCGGNIRVINLLKITLRYESRPTIDPPPATQVREVPIERVANVRRRRGRRRRGQRVYDELTDDINWTTVRCTLCDGLGV